MFRILSWGYICPVSLWSILTINGGSSLPLSQIFQSTSVSEAVVLDLLLFTGAGFVQNTHVLQGVTYAMLASEVSRIRTINVEFINARRCLFCYGRLWHVICEQLLISHIFRLYLANLRIHFCFLGETSESNLRKANADCSRVAWSHIVGTVPFIYCSERCSTGRFC